MTAREKLLKEALSDTQATNLKTVQHLETGSGGEEVIHRFPSLVCLPPVKEVKKSHYREFSPNKLDAAVSHFAEVQAIRLF